jgi:hypothetical protein
MLVIRQVVSSITRGAHFLSLTKALVPDLLSIAAKTVRLLAETFMGQPVGCCATRAQGSILFWATMRRILNTCWLSTEAYALIFEARRVVQMETRVAFLACVRMVLLAISTGLGCAVRAHTLILNTKYTLL